MTEIESSEEFTPAQGVLIASAAVAGGIAAVAVVIGAEELVKRIKRKCYIRKMNKINVIVPDAVIRNA